MCPYEGCNKLYGSDVSLNLHIKLKHNGGNKTEREKLARSIFLAKINGEKVPEVTLNLPPGYLEVDLSMSASKIMKEKDSKGNDSMRSSKNGKDLSLRSSMGDDSMDIKLENQREGEDEDSN